MKSILWRRLDVPGHEAAHLFRSGAGWRIEGASAFLHESVPCSLTYRIECDADWSTRNAFVSGRVGDGAIERRIAVDRRGRWTLDGELQPQLAGCIDVDLNFSPVTNTLPIRRLAIAIGDSAPVRAAWLRFPTFRLEVLDQTYRRAGEHSYRYESGGGSFVAELEVDESGFVTHYPRFFLQEES